ncbi:MAG: hypothetical protein J5515_02640 [Lachnospiraceae bacterium]|nr:hypothetical protein [Lachnospiraceae bacterium]
MYNNLYKSSYVNQDQKVRVIESNDLVAKKLDSIANTIISDNSEEVGEGIMQEVSAANVASLLSDDNDKKVKNFDVTQTINSKNSMSKESVQIVNNMASDIVARANAEAEKIIREATIEAENIKKQAYQQARASGYDEGINAGKEALIEKELLLNKQKEELVEEYRAKIDDIEPALVDVLTDIYEHVFQVDFSDRKEVIYHLAKNTLASMETGKTYTLRLSPDDFNFLTMQKRELVKGSGIPVESLEFIEDKSLTQGNAFIETGGGIFDCSVTTHLDNLRKTLQVLSFEKDK